MAYFEKITSINTNTRTLLEDIFLDPKIRISDYDDAVHQFFFFNYKSRHVEKKQDTENQLLNTQENVYQAVNLETYEEQKDAQISSSVSSDDVFSIKKILNELIELNTKTQLNKGAETESFQRFDMFTKICVFNALKIVNDFQIINPDVYGLVFNLINNMISRRCSIILDESVGLILKMFISYFIYYNIDNAKDFLVGVKDSQDVYKFLGMCFMAKNIHKKFDSLFRLDETQSKKESDRNIDLKQRLRLMKQYDCMLPNKLILDYTGLITVINDLCDLKKIEGYSAQEGLNSAMFFVKQNFVKCLKAMDKIDVMFMYRMIFNITVAHYKKLKPQETLRNQINDYFQSFVIYFNSLDVNEVHKLSVCFWVSGMPLDFVFVVSEVDRQMKQKNGTEEPVELDARHIYLDEMFQSRSELTKYKKELVSKRSIAIEITKFSHLSEEIKNRDGSKRFGLNSDLLVTCINKKFNDKMLNRTCKAYAVLYMKNQMQKKNKHVQFLSFAVRSFEHLVEMNNKSVESKKIDYSHLENVNLLFNLIKTQSGYIEQTYTKQVESINQKAAEVLPLSFTMALVQQIENSTQTKYNIASTSSSSVTNMAQKENICDKYILKFKSANKDSDRLKNTQLIGISNTDMESLLKEIRKTIEVSDETFNTVYHLMRYKYIVDDLIVSTEKLDEMYGTNQGISSLKESVFVLLDRMSSQCEKTFQECISKFLQNHAQGLYPEDVLTKVSKDLKTMMISDMNETVSNFLSDSKQSDEPEYAFDVDDDYVFQKVEHESEKDQTKHIESMYKKISQSDDIKLIDKLNTKIKENINGSNISSEKKQKIDELLKSVLEKTKQESSNKKISSIKKIVENIIVGSGEPILMDIEEIKEMVKSDKQDAVIEETIRQNPDAEDEDIALKSIENVTNKAFRESASKLKKIESQQKSMKLQQSSQKTNSMTKKDIELANDIIEKSLSDVKSAKINSEKQKENIIDLQVEKSKTGLFSSFLKSDNNDTISSISKPSSSKTAFMDDSSDSEDENESMQLNSNDMKALMDSASSKITQNEYTEDDSDDDEQKIDDVETDDDESEKSDEDSENEQVENETSDEDSSDDEVTYSSNKKSSAKQKQSLFDLLSQSMPLVNASSNKKSSPLKKLSSQKTEVDLKKKSSSVKKAKTSQLKKSSNKKKSSSKKASSAIVPAAATSQNLIDFS